MACRKIDIARRWWRPLFAFIAVACIVAIVATVCWMLITTRASLSEASSVLIVLITGILTPLGVFIGGRSYEKVNGADQGVSQAHELHGPYLGQAYSQEDVEDFIDAANGTDLDDAVFDALEVDRKIPKNPMNVPRRVPRRDPTGGAE